MNTSTEHWWNGAHRGGKLTYSETNLSQQHFAHHKSKHRLPKNQTQISTVRSHWLPHVWHSLIV